jgi:NitT/TauT family transport system substrate-binding protein
MLLPRLMRSKWLSLLTAAIFAGSAFTADGPRGAAAQSTLIPLRVATIPSDFAAEVYFGKDMGFFANAGLDVQITPISSGSAIAAAVAGGGVDIGYSNALSVFVAHDKGIPLTLIAAANLYETQAASDGLIAVARNSPIKTAKDFNGKTIAVNALNSMPQLGTRNWIDKNGGDSSTVKFVEIPMTNMVPAVASGRVDASGSFDPTADPDIGKPGDQFRLIAKGFDSVAPNFVSGVWFSTDDFVAKNPEAAKRFVAAMKVTAVWANAHHRESAIILAKYLSVPPDTYANALRADFATRITPDSIKPVIDLAAKYGAIKAAFDPRSVINPLAY